MKRSAVLLFVVGILASLTNCATFLTPAVLDPGELAFGVGIVEAPATDGSPPSLYLAIPIGAIYARMGVAERTEVGIKLEGPFPLILGADIKYQILREPILVAVDLGLRHPIYDIHRFSGRPVRSASSISGIRDAG